MYSSLKSRIKASARSQIAIDSVREGVLRLPGSHYRAILEVSSINFELKSDDEQDSIIEIYESFLNSVGCHLQIMIRTREIDIDKYLIELKERLAHETETIYRAQIDSYEQFIKRLIKSNKILSRHFYIVVPYNAPSKLEFELVQEQLNLQIEIISKGLGRLGMHSRQLSSLEVLDLFYSFYSPEQAKLQPLTYQAIQLVHDSFIHREEVHA